MAHSEESTQYRVYKRKSKIPSDLARISDAITQKSCPICLCEIKPRRVASLPLCRHVFCADCICRWSGYKRVCPLCKAEFGSSLFIIDLSSQTLVKEVLKAPLNYRPTVGFSAPQRNALAELSIYERKLQAVPFESKNRVLEKKEHNSRVKSMVIQRVEPWIHRELEAILKDPNPSIIVHVVTSVLVSTIERGTIVSSEEPGTRDELLAPLRPFLHEKTEHFWHELRCFAESSFSIETYDTVVEYRSNQT
ncbi:unnamed protein product [Cuscuta europaea]|uniref:RING-type E3 ubiquitin transferase n=1 Tax=Cuscuta europaea TaxID=41803 RepID=A0A9P1E1F8_CUSEU|nr:unnamed protein product [Cuscuta europaea]